MKSVDMVREGGLVAFITSQGVLNAEQGRPVREWLMNRCEPVSAIRLPNNLFTEHAGTEVGSDLVILQKKAATGELSERQRDFIESRKLSNGIRINNLFQSFDRVIHTEAKVGKDPYGKPAMEFTHAEGVDGIDREMRRMLSEDFNRHFNESYCLEHAPEQTPGTPGGNCPVPVRRNASVPKDTSPALPEKSSRRLSPTPVTFSSSGKRRKNAASSPEMAAQGYHVDTETGEITRIENKPGQVLPDSAATPAGEPTGEDLADFGAWSKERENRLWEQHPPKPEDFGMADTPVQHVGGTTEPKPREGFAGSLFDTVETARCRTGKRAAGTVADALRPVRLQRRGAAAGRTRYIQEKEQPPGSKAEDAPATLVIRPGLLSGGTEERNAENDATGA